MESKKTIHEVLKMQQIYFLPKYIKWICRGVRAQERRPLQY